MAQPLKTFTFIGYSPVDIAIAIRMAEEQAVARLKEYGPNAPISPFAVQTVADGSGWRHLITYLVPFDY